MLRNMTDSLYRINQDKIEKQKILLSKKVVVQKLKELH